MSDIDFQNGLLCGMAVKGLVRAGAQYTPIIWNDSGVYDYFYIDFKRALNPFSQGMIAQSMVVHDSEQLAITGLAYVSPGVYKVYCNIANKYHGITVINKATSLLTFASGGQVPPFSIHMFIAGITSYLDTDYAYDYTTFMELYDMLETVTMDASWTNIDEIAPSVEHEHWAFSVGNKNETVSVVLT